MSETKSLPALVMEATAIADKIAEAEGVITPEIEALLDRSNQELATKADAYFFVMQALEMQIEAAEDRIVQWAVFVKARKAALQNMSDRMKLGMQALDMPEIAGSEVTFKLQANPPSCFIENESQIPEEFITIEVPPPIKKIDKKQIIEALKIGKPVPGARLERSVRLVKKVGTAKPTKALA